MAGTTHATTRRSRPADWTYAEIRESLQRTPTAGLVRDADDLAHFPAALRPDAWPWLAAVALELGARAVRAEAAPGEPAAVQGGLPEFGPPR